jgi:hypothetical protein
MFSAHCRHEMTIRLTTALLAFVSVAGAGIATTAELKNTAPAKVNLTGLWKINDELSDDPHKVVAQKKENSSSGGPIRGGGSGTRGGATTGGTSVDVGSILGEIFDTARGGSGGGNTGGNGDRPKGDPEPSSRRVPLDSFLATREELEIDQQPDAVSINTVEEKTSCKPADPGQAPAPGGEMVDQRCGWQGSTWVVELKSPDGLKRTTRYELRKGGEQLVMVSEVKGGHTQLSGLQIRRVYDRLVLN